jgi:hypothetical protein
VDASLIPTDPDAQLAFGLQLAEQMLDEPRLAPLVEALTCPQLPARPTQVRCMALVEESHWQVPFIVVCGRLLTHSPELAPRVAAALEQLDAEVADVVRRLLPVPQLKRPLVFAAELVEEPGIVGAVGAGDELLVYAPGWSAERIGAELAPLVDGVENVTALAPATADDAGAAGAATAVITRHALPIAFAGVPVVVPPARHYLSLCSIFKNEAPYLREYIEFHRLLGVDHFYLYENFSGDSWEGVLQPYVEAGIVTLHRWTIDPGQNAAYTHCVTEHGHESEWIAFVDVDEFFYAPGGDLKGALAEFELPHVGGVAVNYVNYGTSGHDATPDGLVIENYLHRAGHGTALDLPAGLRAPGLDPTDLRNYHPLNARISSVVRPQRTLRFDIPHHPVYKPGFHAVTENHTRLDGAIAPFTSVSKLRMNHYWTKSKAECQAKFERGRSDQAGARKWPDDFLHRERAINEVHDTEILYWLEPLKQAMGLFADDELAA